MVSVEVLNSSRRVVVVSSQDLTLLEAMAALEARPHLYLEHLGDFCIRTCGLTPVESRLAPISGTWGTLARALE